MPNLTFTLTIPEARSAEAIKAACNYGELPESAANAKVVAANLLHAALEAQLKKEQALTPIPVT